MCYVGARVCEFLFIFGFVLKNQDRNDMKLKKRNSLCWCQICIMFWISGIILFVFVTFSLIFEERKLFNFIGEFAFQVLFFGIKHIYMYKLIGDQSFFFSNFIRTVSISLCMCVVHEMRAPKKKKKPINQMIANLISI